MIEEVEITDETLDSTELSNQELVRSEDLNAVLKQLPPEAFNELFSGEELVFCSKIVCEICRFNFSYSRGKFKKKKGIEPSRL